MIHLRLHLAIFILASVALLLTSCASAPPIAPVGPPPDVQLGPELEVLQFSTSHDLVSTVLDGKGSAHVFIAVANTKEIHHVVVSPEGNMKHELVAANRSPSTISAAFDSRARPHLLLDDAELVREESNWISYPTPPWHVEGIKVHKPRLVQAQNGLIRAFLVNGKEVGASGRWDWFGFGGYGAGIIIPWHATSEKLVVVPESAIAEPFWYVVDPEDKLDTSDAMFATDNAGNLSVVYSASRFMVARKSHQPRYARIALMPLQPGIRQAGTEIPGNRRLHPVSGNEIPLFVTDTLGFEQAAAAQDPVSGTLLIVRAHDSSIGLMHGEWSLPLRLPLTNFFEPRLASAGGDRFHLMTVDKAEVLYLQYAQGSWSAPVKLGKSEVASTFGYGWDALDMASKGNNRAFAVWPTRTGIVGRWVEGFERTPATTGNAPAQKQNEPRIQTHLLDFANGKAALMTPGITSGFSEAAAAATNGLLTKRLHDTGQWTTLATVVLRDNYGDNLRWYYLGRAAEGMALCDTAEHYYQVSKERSESFWTRCLSIACHGFKLPQILPDRIDAVEGMRSAGKCSTP